MFMSPMVTTGKKNDLKHGANSYVDPFLLDLLGKILTFQEGEQSLPWYDFLSLWSISASILDVGFAKFQGQKLWVGSPAKDQINKLNLYSHFHIYKSIL